MSVAVERRSQDITIARISGQIGLEALIGVDGKCTGISGNNALDESLRKAIPTPVKIVIVDLSDATFLSSIGISALVRLKNRMAPTGDVRVVVVGNLVSLMKCGRLDRLFKIYQTVDAAMGE